MKTLPAAILMGIASAVAPATAFPFEGKIDLLHSEGRETLHLSYYLKGDAMRIESTGGDDEAFAMIIDMEKKQSMMLMPSEKMYMVTSLDALSGAANAADAGPAPVKTGRTGKILGYDCVEYTVTDKKSVTEYWAAKGLGAFRALARGGPGDAHAGASAWEIEAMKDGLFPLRIVERNNKGKEISRTEATSIKPGPLDAGLFAPPKDFQKFEMPSFGNMFGG